MTVPPENTLADPEQLIPDLQRQLAERDEAPQREIRTAEVLQVINSSPGDLTPVFTIHLLRGRHWQRQRMPVAPAARDAERSGRRVGRIWTPAISTHDGLAPIAMICRIHRKQLP